MTFALICIACDDDDDHSSSSITSIFQLLGKANTVVLNKALECCMPALSSEQSASFESSIQPSLNALYEAETNGWIRFNVDQANLCFEAFKTKIENSSCESLNQSTSDLYEIDIKSCNVYERLQTENQPCGPQPDTSSEERYVIENLGVCAGDLYCSNSKLDDQERPTCQKHQSGAYCGSGDISVESVTLTPEICPDTEICTFQTENGQFVPKCITKVGEGGVCGEIKKDTFDINIVDYGNCDGDLVCDIQEKDGTPQALCMKKLVVGDICRIDYTYAYEGEMIKTFFSYDCPNQTTCLKNDEKYTCQPQKKINEVCGEINQFGFQPFSYDVCEKGLFCRSKYQDSKNLITCQPLAQIGESCKDTWKNSNDMSALESYDSSDLSCVDGAICEDQGEGNFNCVDDPQIVMIGESCNIEFSCGSDAYCDNGICSSFGQPQSFCEEIQSFQ
jgi:hypothetical protein